MHKMITIEQAEVLLDKYYEGFTSVEEEKLLQAFLSQKNLPGQFDADKAMLSYFASQKKKSKVQIIPLIRWSSIAAAVIIGILIVNFLSSGKSESYAYIDGKKITDIKQVKEQVLVSIQSWNNSDTNLELDMDELINQQLQLFVK